MGTISNIGAKDALDAITVLLAAGATNPTPKLRIYDGTAPDRPDSALSGNVLLSEHDIMAEALSAVVAAGGTGYTVGDDISLLGGTLGTGQAAAVFNVDTVSGGVVTAVSLVSSGGYETAPTNPVSTGGGTGTGCTLTVTFLPSFGAAFDISISSVAAATANTILDDTDANATAAAGGATFGRFFSRGEVPIIQGEVADTGSPEITINNADIQIGTKVEVTSVIIRMPEGTHP